MEYGRSAVKKKMLNDVQRGRTKLLEYTESEGLSDGRLDAVEDCICARAFHPFGIAVGEEATTRFRILSTCVPFGSLQTLRECKIRKLHRFDYAHELELVTRTALLGQA